MRQLCRRPLAGLVLATLALSAVGIAAAPEACWIPADSPDGGDHISALQRDSNLQQRWLQRAALAGGPEASEASEAGHPALQQDGAGGGAQAKVEDFEDYRSDAEAFLQRQGAVSCDLPRVSAAEASRVFAELVQEFANEEGAEPLVLQPWLTEKRSKGQKPTPVDKARYFLASRLFNGPGIVEGISDSWPAMKRWQEDSMKSLLEGRHFRLTHFNYPDYVHAVSDADYTQGITLRQYLDSGLSSKGYFLFVNEPEEPHKSNIQSTVEELRSMGTLREDFMPHPLFSSTPEERHGLMALDGVGSSHGLHIHGPVWQTQVAGRKAWWLLPADIVGDKTAAGAHSKEFIGENSILRNQRGSAPIVGGYLYKEPNACVFLQRRAPPPGSRLCVAAPGETVLLPEDTWHGTCALDRHTASIGGWMADRRGVNDE